MDGVIVVDKPTGPSSHDIVQRVRRLVGIRRIGHLGTLDPLGTGVLPLVIGRATRLSQFFLLHDRTYEAVVRCGFATTTFDAEGERVGPQVEPGLSSEDLETVLEEFRGEILQRPPPVSAKKIGGVRAYKLARQNKPVELTPAAVQIHRLELLALEADRFTIRVQSSAGCYVRSLAHEIGQRLGSGAHLAALRRTAMGQFDLTIAWDLDRLAQLQQEGRIEEALVKPETLLPEYPVERVDDVEAARIARGQDFRAKSLLVRAPARRVKAVAPNGRLIAIGELRAPPVYHPIVVF